MEKHKALVMGRIEKKRYYFSREYRYHWYDEGEIKINGHFVEHKEIWKGELENPPLERDDYLYIIDMNKKVRVADKAKSTEGGYIYWTNFVEYIEDEETETTRLKAEEDKVKWKKYTENLEQQRKEKEEEKKATDLKESKKWWQFWK